MKEIHELNLPENLRYTENHEWAEKKSDVIRVGITDYAQDQLGDIVYVELPDVGSKFEAGDEFGTVESVKAVSELFMPVSGEITTINKNLENNPEFVNSEPYNGGWMIEIKPDNPEQFETLITQENYLASLEL